MSTYLIKEETLNDIADAIREKTGSQDTIQVSNFDTAIQNIPTSSGYPPDWSQIGYSDTPQGIIDIYNYAKYIYDNWENVSNLENKFYNDIDLIVMPFVDTSNATTMLYMFRNCSYLISIPQLNTSNVTNMNATFNSCYRLRDVPILDTSKVTTMNKPFNSCSNLSNESLDNILQMCINATSFSGTKTLVQMGLSSSSYSASRIQALPHYQDFIDAGWTIGY